MFAHLNEVFTRCLCSAFWVTAAAIAGVIIVPAKLQYVTGVRMLACFQDCAFRI